MFTMLAMFLGLAIDLVRGGMDPATSGGGGGAGNTLVDRAGNFVIDRAANNVVMR